MDYKPPWVMLPQAHEKEHILQTMKESVLVFQIKVVECFKRTLMPTKWSNKILDFRASDLSSKPVGFFLFSCSLNPSHVALLSLLSPWSTELLRHDLTNVNFTCSCSHINHHNRYKTRSMRRLCKLHQLLKCY